MKTKAKPKKRLSKLPLGRADYIVEFIWDDGAINEVHYFLDRKDAREFAKGWSDADRVRIFRVKYELVSDRKRK